MVTLCWAAKGGSGTTVVTVALALECNHHALIVDLDGEVPAVLGLPEPDRPGVLDWLASDAPANQIADLVVDFERNASYLPHRLGSGPRPLRSADESRWSELARWVGGQRDTGGVDVFIDGGTGSPHQALIEVADRSLLVTRPCYLSLRRAVRSGIRPTGVVLVAEPGHGLTSRDVEHAIGAPVIATVSFDPAVARAVDAGLLGSRLPRVISRELRRAVA